MSNTSFDTACLFVQRNEGPEFSDDQYDAGGATRWGVTQADLAKYLGRAVSKTEVKNLSQSLAAQVLKKMYWIPEYEQLPQSIATSLVDWCFLHGNTSGRVMAQKALNELGAHISADGVIGQASIKAFNDVRPAYFLNQFKLDILHYFDEVVRVNPTQKRFLAGWTARINRYTSLV